MSPRVYERIESDLQQPTTSQPTIEDFCRAYSFMKVPRKLSCITINGAMSSTFRMASTTPRGWRASACGRLGNTMMLGWQVIATARAVELANGCGSVASPLTLRQRIYLYVGGYIPCQLKAAASRDAIGWLRAIPSRS